MALTTPSTPKNQFVTPRRLGAIKSSAPETPECFNNVTLETPIRSAKRRSSKESKFDEVSNLTVAVRIRPMNARELACVGVTDVVKVVNESLIIRTNPVGNTAMSIDHIFHYDHIFWSCDMNTPKYCSQEDVFVAIGKPLLRSAFHGYNACLFAYGQTGSGKSYSMMGLNTSDQIDIDSEQNCGIIPRFCRELFKRISDLNSDCTASVEVSYFEIYNEKIHDLLAETTNNRTPLKVREHPVWGPYVVDLSVHNVKTYQELRSWLLMGNKNRATAATAMNEKSSRSHSIFSIELCLTDGSNENDSSRRSKVSLVDLAGSERLSNNQNNDERIRQGVCINKSLLTLGKVISALAEQRKNNFVPYRDSVLTWLLRESLGGNSLTSMLATITPASNHVDETLATLRYACQARSIVNRARINENPHDRLIRELRAEVERLRALKQDYERSSFSSIIQIDDSVEQEQEVEELKEKLSQTESRLLEAERSWQQRLMETKQNQLKELAEAEKRREELESQFRIMKTIDTNIKVSPYRSNFLEQLEDVLTDKENSETQPSPLKLLRNRFLNFGMSVEFAVNQANSMIHITDSVSKKKTMCTFEDVTLVDNKNVDEFIQNLSWVSTPKRSTKKLSKTEIVMTMNQIYEALSTFQTMIDTEDNLRLLFARANKSLQSLETALVKVSNSTPKSVTFKV